MAIELDKIAVVGLGYVGLPLAVAFGAKRPVVGFDPNERRIAELRSGVDKTQEVTQDQLLGSSGLSFTADPQGIADCSIYIVTVPTPIDRYKRPDLGALRKASETIGKLLKSGDTVIYESTVYPGATEEECLPILERESGLRLNRDFFLGYSPERINPGDKQHRLENIKKIVSGSNELAAEKIRSMYAEVVTAGVHLAPTIKVAEAAKVIENTQRDINIALVNEFALIFHKMGINTIDVLEAAETKWNFLPFRPGLVGGHCIGVDPYYLTHKAVEIGHHPEVILAGRRINEGLGTWVGGRVVRSMVKRGVNLANARVLVMGLSFKENCPDIRNTRVVDVVRELTESNITVDVHDPWVDPEEAMAEHGIELVEELRPSTYSAVVLAVAHNKFKDRGVGEIRQLCAPGGILFDVKGMFPRSETDEQL